MAITDNFREQHKEILEISTRISAHLNPDELSKNATEVHGLLSELAENLNFHLTMVDKALYPALLRQPDEKIRTLAKGYLNEMDSAGEAYKTYMARWSKGMAVQESPNDFIDETQKILNVLSLQINKEDKALYPLAENVLSL